MVEDDRNCKSVDEAAEFVGRAIYGDDWIGALTERERWLIERYVEGFKLVRTSSIMPPTDRWVIAGRSWAEIPGDPTLKAEVERARDGKDFSEEQWERALEWLEANGFDTEASNISSDALARAVETHFPTKTKMILRAVSPKKPRTYEAGEKVKKLLKECFPDGIPMPEKESNSNLVRIVQKKHDDKFPNQQAPHRDTILRHAGRKPQSVA